MKNEKDDKTWRQLELFSVFNNLQIFKYKYLKGYITASPKTIKRDIEDLTDAGLIDVFFSNINNGYVHQPDCKPPILDTDNEHRLKRPCLGENQARNRHLLKLNRLATLIFFMKNEDIPCYEKIGYIDEDDYLWAIEAPEDYLLFKEVFPEGDENGHYDNYIDWYKANFPECSRSTMYRDFKDLESVGVTIGYNEEYRYYQCDFDGFFELKILCCPYL